MPVLIIKTSAPIPEAKEQDFLKAASMVLVDAANKKESHVMVVLERAEICMGGKTEPAAFAEVRSMVGLTHEVNHKISEALCALLESNLGINAHRIYINFTLVPESAWGWEYGIVVWNHAQKKWVIE